jgi:hypothetical protein
MSFAPSTKLGPKTQISNEGGGEQVWSRDGRELFYINGLRTMAADARTQPVFTASSPRPLFTGNFVGSPNGVSGYDVSPDGKRFLKVQSTGSDQTNQINIVVNWLEELKQRAGAR